MNLLQSILILFVRVYRWLVAPALGALFGPACGCRFTPTCSAYALGSLQRHGAISGTVLTAKRLCRCHPWGRGGNDPVPETVPVVIEGTKNNMAACH